MISTKEADAFIANMPEMQRTTSLPLLACHGKCLAEELRAFRDQPPFHRVAMDGIAIRASDFASSSASDDDNSLYHALIVGVQAAGHEQLDLDDFAKQGPRLALEVMTGAPLPKHCDVVLPYEVLTINAGQVSFSTSEKMQVLRNVHPQGADFRADDVLLAPGTILDGPRLGLLASQGLETAQIIAPLRITVVTTGDELIPPGEPLLPHQIHSSNDIAMAALLQSADLDSEVTLRHLQDDEAEIFSSLQEILTSSDVVILSGGVSKGKFDYVPAALEKLGVVKCFHRVQQKPGKPFWAGTAPNALVFALPGNPVATMVGMRRYVLPKLLRCTAQKPLAVCSVVVDEAKSFPTPLTRFLQVRLQPCEEDDRCEMRATLLSSNGSGDFASSARSDGFIEVPSTQQQIVAGDRFRFYSWNR